MNPFDEARYRAHWDLNNVFGRATLWVAEQMGPGRFAVPTSYTETGDVMFTTLEEAEGIALDSASMPLLKAVPVGMMKAIINAGQEHSDAHWKARYAELEKHTHDLVSHFERFHDYERARVDQLLTIAMQPK